jgi:hypothetical protein
MSLREILLLSNVTVSKRKERGREEGGRESLPIGGNENTDLLKAMHTTR